MSIDLCLMLAQANDCPIAFRITLKNIWQGCRAGPRYLLSTSKALGGRPVITAADVRVRTMPMPGWGNRGMLSLESHSDQVFAGGSDTSPVAGKALIPVKAFGCIITVWPQQHPAEGIQLGY